MNTCTSPPGRSSFTSRTRQGGSIPKILRYKTHADESSLYHTPPTFSVYLARNVLDVVKRAGGLAAMAKKNRAKAALLYGALDASADFYKCPVERDSRSLMNVVFTLPTPDLEKAFVSQAEAKRLVGLKGHRSVGGIRASLYNAVSLEWVQALVDFMSDFRKRA